MSTTKIVDHLGVTDGRVPPAVLAAGAWVAQSLVSRERGGRFVSQASEHYVRHASSLIGQRGTVATYSAYVAPNFTASISSSAAIWRECSR